MCGKISRMRKTFVRLAFAAVVGLLPVVVMTQSAPADAVSARAKQRVLFVVAGMVSKRWLESKGRISVLACP